VLPSSITCDLLAETEPESINPAILLVPTSPPLSIDVTCLAIAFANMSLDAFRICDFSPSRSILHYSLCAPDTAAAALPVDWLPFRPPAQTRLQLSNLLFKSPFIDVAPLAPISLALPPSKACVTLNISLSLSV
jgi:hypothetical protein